MNREQKRKLGVLAVLGLALLVGGTFAFQSFNQRAINDRLRDNEFEVGGRVHDYYNRDTENKDVFVENYGEEPIMARIRLSEFMEIRKRGETSFTPVVLNTERGEVETWTTYIPDGNSLTTRVGDSAAFNQYSNLTFGWTRGGEYAPWYLPTFNHVENDLMTAAAGHARDYIAGAGATDGSTDGATHPGDGTDAYWQEDVTYTNGSQGETWLGASDGTERTTAQNLPQDRAPMTLQQWAALPNEHKIGDFWVIDHETGWAYWASQLQVGETSSYLLDAAQMTEVAHDIRGSYYYGIHVDSQLISPDIVFEDEPQEGHGGSLGQLLDGIRNNAVDDEEFENPDYDEDSLPDAFRFSTMSPGRIFTMAGEQYRYLEDMGDGNHMIILEQGLPRAPSGGMDARISAWYRELDISVQNIVSPVLVNLTVRAGASSFTWSNPDYWNRLPLDLHVRPDVAADVTAVVAVEDGGVKRAFALSLADMVRLSQPGKIFSTQAGRKIPIRDSGVVTQAWRLRIRSTEIGGNNWIVESYSPFSPQIRGTRLNVFGGDRSDDADRPALIIHQ